MSIRDLQMHNGGELTSSHDGSFRKAVIQGALSFFSKDCGPLRHNLQQSVFGQFGGKPASTPHLDSTATDVISYPTLLSQFTTDVHLELFSTAFTTSSENFMSRVNCERYVIETPRLRSGGFGDVYRALDLLTSETVLLKTVQCATLFGLDDPAARRTFFQNAAATARLGRAGDHVVRMLDFGYDQVENVPFVITEYIAGKDLQDDIGNLTLQQGAVVLLQILKALQSAQDRGLIHGDISPVNIVRTEDQQGTLALDNFGLTPLLTAQLKSTGRGESLVAGKPGYVPPAEWQSGRRSIYSDMFGLSASVTVLVSGRLPEYQWSEGSLMRPDLRACFSSDDVSSSVTPSDHLTVGDEHVELSGDDIVECLQRMIDDEHYSANKALSDLVVRSNENVEAREAERLREEEAKREADEAARLKRAKAQATRLEAARLQAAKELEQKRSPVKLQTTQTSAVPASAGN